MRRFKEEAEEYSRRIFRDLRRAAAATVEESCANARNQGTGGRDPIKQADLGRGSQLVEVDHPTLEQMDAESGKLLCQADQANARLGCYR